MPSLVPLDSSLGAEFIGIIVSTIIYGITCLQVYLYYTEHSSRDPKLLRIFVGCLMAIDTLHVALLGNLGYSYSVTNFGDYTFLQNSSWSLLAQIVVGNFLSLCVKMFYMRRVYILSARKPYIPMFLITAAFAHFACTLVYVIRSSQIHEYTKAAQVARPWTVTIFTLDMVMDTVIAVSVIYYLLKSRTSFSRTNRMVHMLVAYILNSCLLTMVFTAITLALFVSRPDTLYYAPWYFSVIRLYSCALLSTLNSRDHVREAGFSNQSEMITITMQTNTAVLHDHEASTHNHTNKSSSGQIPVRSSRTGADDLSVYDMKTAGGHAV